jgi:hypothetical protein
MFSGQLRRRNTNETLAKETSPSPTRKKFRSGSTTDLSPREGVSTTAFRRSMGFAASHAALHVTGFFRPGNDVAILNDKVLVTLPTRTLGILWDSWDRKLIKYENTEKDYEKLVRDLNALDVALRNQLHHCNNNLAMIQTYTSLGAGSSEVVQTIMALFDFVNPEDYATFQVCFAGVTAGLALLAKFISSEVVNVRNNAMAYQNEVKEMLNTQNNKLPMAPDKFFFKTPTPSPVARRIIKSSVSTSTESTPLLVDTDTHPAYSAELMSIATAASANKPVSTDEKAVLHTDSPFVKMEGIIINGSEIDVNVPVRVRNWFGRDSWEIETKAFPNDEEGFIAFITLLEETGVELDNRIDDFNERNFTVTTVTANLIAMLEIVKTSITAAQPFSPAAYKYFQTGVSAATACFSFFSQYASSTTAAGRDEAAKYKGRLSDMLNKQFRP